MSLSERARKLFGDPRVRDIINLARRNAESRYLRVLLPDGEFEAEIRREGLYPLVTPEGSFKATLLRCVSLGKNHSFRGGEFRFLCNASFDELEAGGEIKVILESLPICLKELSLPWVQELLASARKKVAQCHGRAVLIQSRSTDLHDGEFRNTPDGQHDILEELWLAKVLTVMKLYPGIEYFAAARILSRMGEHPYFADYGLGISVLISYLLQNVEADMDIEVIEAANLVSPFPSNAEESGVEAMSIDNENITRVLEENLSPDLKYIWVDGNLFEVSTIARYPIMIEGHEFGVQLVIIKKDGEVAPCTVRIVRSGTNVEFLRLDSICINGVQGGDNHCDCRQQTEKEINRAIASGVSIILISFRDEEGRNHGEGNKGDTLSVERMINALFPNDPIGNGTAAQLYYQDTGERVDARDYAYAQAVLQYLGINYIPYLVTNNQAKVAAVRKVARIGEVVSALNNSLSDEAAMTKKEKFDGDTGVEYR